MTDKNRYRYDKKAVKGILFRLLGYMLPALLIELVYFISQPQLTELEWGEQKLMLLVHGAAAFCFVLRLLPKKLPRAINWAVFAVSPAAAFFAMEYITHFAIRDMSFAVIMLNLLLFYLLALFLLGLCSSTAAAVTIETVFTVVVGLISYYVAQFRGNPLLPWDISSIGTAMGVVSNYEFIPFPRGLFVFAVAAALITLSIKCNERFLPGKLLPRMGCTLAFAGLLTGSCFYARSEHCRKSFSLMRNSSDIAGSYSKNGLIVGFLAATNSEQRPEGYSLKAVEQIAGSYVSDSVDPEGERPNVIVIMNETFADLSVLTDFDTSEELFPFISSMDENTYKGKVYVSVLGGNTPNSEFEFLTGSTMGFMPQGSVAYKQLYQSVPTLADQFDAMGYRVMGMHAYWSPLWNRDKVYPFLGFDETMFLEDFPQDVEKLRIWPTDRAMYKEIEKVFEESEEPLFLFGITMMNHGGYVGMLDEFDCPITVDGLEADAAVTEYMSLMRETDRQFEELIEYFSKTDEKTIILMFGDHQPNSIISDPILELKGQSLDMGDPQQASKKYITPYILWSNYELEGEMPEELSLNYLAAHMMQLCGLETTASQKFLLELYKEYPVICSQGFRKGEGPMQDIAGYASEQELLGYAFMQYNYMLGSSDRVESFWSLGE